MSLTWSGPAWRRCQLSCGGKAGKTSSRADRDGIVSQVAARRRPARAECSHVRGESVWPRPVLFTLLTAGCRATLVSLSSSPSSRLFSALLVGLLSLSSSPPTLPVGLSCPAAVGLHPPFICTFTMREIVRLPPAVKPLHAWRSPAPPCMALQHAMTQAYATSRSISRPANVYAAPVRVALALLTRPGQPNRCCLLVCDSTTSAVTPLTRCNRQTISGEHGLDSSGV